MSKRRHRTLKLDSRGYWYDQRIENGSRVTRTFGHRSKTPRSNAEIQWRRWLTQQSIQTSDSPTIEEAIQAYITHARSYYPKTEHSEFHNILFALRSFMGSQPGHPVNAVRPSHVKTWLDVLAATGLATTTLRSRLGILKRCFKWLVSEELVEPSVYHAITTVGTERRGRRTEFVGPVALIRVAATLPFMAETVRAIVRLQLLTAMRPGEVVTLARPSIDDSRTPWRATVSEHKSAWRGKGRIVHFGPDARQVLEPFMDRKGLLFCNHDGNAFTSRTYRQAIWRACDAWSLHFGYRGKKRLANRWSPNRLRKTRLTELEQMVGLDSSRAVAGHSKLETTQQFYIARDDKLARDAMEKTG